MHLALHRVAAEDAAVGWRIGRGRSGRMVMHVVVVVVLGHLMHLGLHVDCSTARTRQRSGTADYAPVVPLRATGRPFRAADGCLQVVMW